MVAGFEQRPWTPTVRRGQIAAETSTPGPAAVTLPSLIGNMQKTVNLGKKKLFLFFLMQATK